MLTVNAMVRKNGAIGEFYTYIFQMEDPRANKATAPLTRDLVFHKWHDQFGKEWELHHIEEVTINPE